MSGGAHFLNTAKKLNEEGVDAVARMRAVPIAVSKSRLIMDDLCVIGDVPRLCYCSVVLSRGVESVCAA